MKKKRNRWLRPAVQASVFGIVLIVTSANALREAGIAIPLIQGASLHAICPFGGVETLYRLFTEGTYLQKIHSSSLILMGAVFFTALLFGPAFCGWICPFGTFQEFLGKIGKRIFRKKYNSLIPRKADRILRYLRYAVLALVLYNTAVTAKLIFQNVDPYYALFNFFTGEVAVTAYIILGAVAAASLIVERPFCKYACPYGAVLGISNLFRIFKIRRNAHTCTGCKACDRKCPMNIEVSGAGAVYDHQCISCMECTSEQVCPVENTVSLRIGGGSHED